MDRTVYAVFENLYRQSSLRKKMELKMTASLKFLFKNDTTKLTCLRSFAMKSVNVYNYTDALRRQVECI